MSRWRVHLMALGAFLIFPSLAIWFDLNGGEFLRWLLTFFAFGAFALYAAATSAAVAIFRLEPRAVVILHASLFAITLTIVGIWAAKAANSQPAQLTQTQFVKPRSA